MALVLARFLDHRLASYGRSGAPKLKDIFALALTPEERAAFDADFAGWLSGPDAAAALAAGAALRNRLPPELARGLGAIGLDEAGLARVLESRIRAFADATWGRWQLMQDAVDQLEASRKTLDKTDIDGFRKLDRALGLLRSQQRLYVDQFVVDQLSRRAVIPTYSFPVHSVSLEVINTAGQRADTAVLELDRDGAIGISEYAPGAEIVAGGRVWTSAGISKRSKFTGDDTFIDRANYRVCDGCGCRR